MKKSYGYIMIAAGVLLLTFQFATGSTPMSSFDLFQLSDDKQDQVHLYFENPQATAPVTIKFTGTVSEYQGGYRSFLYMVRGAFHGYRQAYVSLNLTIGDYFESKSVELKVSRMHESYEKYSLTIEGVFDVPAGLVVPYMEHDLDAGGSPIPDRGHLPFEVSYILTFEQGSTYSHVADGIAIVSIVGDVSDYVKEVTPPEPDDPDQPQPSDEIPDRVDDDVDEAPIGLDDTENVDENGGSQVITSSQPTFLPLGINIFSIGLIAIGSVVVYKSRKSGED